MDSSAAQPAPVSEVQPNRIGPALPAEARLEMPRRRVHEPRQRMRGHPGWWTVLQTTLARLFVAGVTLALAAYGIREMYGVLSTNTITALQWAFLILFAVNFSWIAFAFAQATLGFLAGFAPRFGARLEHAGELPFRTAVLVPVYNEEPLRIAAAIRTMREGLARLEPCKYAFFILSDTNRPDAWLNEEAVFRELTGIDGSGCPVYYRHRAANPERKAGNIADWVQRWGGDYEAMIVLDADSVMSPDSMVTLSHRLAANPALGLIQTLPYIVRGRSVYGRLQQFANQCYGPVYARGLAAWHGWSSNFWGHNAIIRTRAFAESACLPLLNGPPPFGGHILSHDFIEAALLRRAGWGVRFDCDIRHSFEEAPPSLIDVMVRDRRWCQGNLQHGRLLLARGLSLATRIHLFTGIMSYLSAVFWLMLVVLGLAIALQASLVRPEYFAQPSLFPTWPVFDAERARWLFGVSMAVILAPKFFGGALALLKPRRLSGFGGPVLLFLSLLLEILLSALYAPILMLAQTRVVWQILRGRDSGWQPQSRDDGALSLSTALRAHWAHTLFGVVVAATAWFLNHELFLWLLPITAGLILSIVLSWLSGGASKGRLLDLLGLLRAPDERRPCAVLAQLQLELDKPAPSSCLVAPGLPLVSLQQSEALRRWHLAQLPEQTPMRGVETFHAPLVTAQWKVAHAHTLAELQGCLSSAELMALLQRPSLLSRAQRLPSRLDSPLIFARRPACCTAFKNSLDS